MGDSPSSRGRVLQQDRQEARGRLDPASCEGEAGAAGSLGGVCPTEIQGQVQESPLELTLGTQGWCSAEATGRQVPGGGTMCWGSGAREALSVETLKPSSSLF